MNSVRINGYRPGQGIFPHCDGPVYYPKDALARLKCLEKHFRGSRYDGQTSIPAPETFLRPAAHERCNLIACIPGGSCKWDAAAEFLRPTCGEAGQMAPKIHLSKM